MFGLFSSQGFKYITPDLEKGEAYLYNSYRDVSAGVHIFRNLNSKFKDDKVFYESDSCFFCIDGVVINLQQLKNSHAQHSTEVLLEKLWNQYGASFVKEMRGDFSMIIYDKNTQTQYIYTNLTSSKPIYYTEDISKGFCGCSNFEFLVNTCKQEEASLTVDIEAYYSLLCFGNVLGDRTLYKELKKLTPGCYLEVTRSQVKKHEYYKLQQRSSNISFNAAIDGFQEVFDQAIRLQFDKDLEYGYDHLCGLSGGLDSRMTVIAGANTGYKNIGRFTFSTKGYWDDAIAHHISKDLSLKNHVYYIENFDHLKNIEPVFKQNSGLVFYHLTSQIPSMYNKLDFSKYGILHSGQVGDAVLGNTLHPYEVHQDFVSKRSYHEGLYSSHVASIWKQECTMYENVEIAQFYNHVYNGTMNGNWLIYPHTESVSPFLYQEVLDFCFSLPLPYRHKHKLYSAWIEKYHPNAGKYYYEKTKTRTLPRPGNNKWIRRIKNRIQIEQLKSFGLDLTVKSLLGKSDWFSDDMATWYSDVIADLLPHISDIVLKNAIKEQSEMNHPDAQFLAFHVAYTYVKYHGGSHQYST